jgi:CRISPR/Cas system CMR subunit Cmr6 (Cas7 group RAMP superfamily)
MNDHMMDSFIEIELFQETPYYAGTEVYGVIHLFAKDNLNDTNKITLSFDGEESVSLFLNKKKNDETKQTNQIISHIFTIYDYTDYYNVI